MGERRVARRFVAGVLVLLVGSTAVAPTHAALLPDDVTVEGRVTDRRGVPVEGVTVHDQPPQVGTAHQTTTTDAEGRYAFEVPRGSDVHLVFDDPRFDPASATYRADDDVVHDQVLAYDVDVRADTDGDVVTLEAVTGAPDPGASSCVRFETDHHGGAGGEHVGAGRFRWALDVADEPEGTYTARALVVDCDDPSAFLSDPFFRKATWYRVDRTAPVALAAEPSGPTRGEVAIRVEVGDDRDELDREGSTVLVDGEPVAERAFDRDWDLAVPVEGLASGVHTATVVLRDQAGNASDPITLEWLVDVDGPELLDIEPQGVVTERRPVLSFTADEAGGVGATHGGAVLELTDALGTTTTLWPGFDPATGRFTAQRRLPLLVDGVHRVRVTVRDLLGNATVRAWTFELRTLT